MVKVQDISRLLKSRKILQCYIDLLKLPTTETEVKIVLLEVLSDIVRNCLNTWLVFTKELDGLVLIAKELKETMNVDEMYSDCKSK